MSLTPKPHQVIGYAPEALREFHQYLVQWIDNLHFLRRPGDFLVEPESLPRYLHYASERWIEAGWDGDGEIQLLWLPGFIFPSASKVGTDGVAVWHVKQLEDGISWLLSPVALPWL